ncbi:Plasmid pRiA4b ORF-3-like protein [Bacteroidales bacterium Barb7]|nr:Plasmid pRiA4b ORF-3-like protein [Bacteroidales bacterium Barb4]OAV67805.1 Plasmid pRiA4b ORF-3-like protein [Bacteroidales bacterium Barb6XT]OAV74183.1 Plasmid pRiA4b ORF-3-like protein [Bacteroidales bacterium Barb7]
MIYRFLLLSDEVDDFKREIQISSEATFLDLHNAILDSVNYDKDQMTSFFLCDDDWTKGAEVTLVEMDTSSDVDIFLMESTRLDELLDEERQKLLFVFDYMTERAFFMELREIITRKDLTAAVVSQSRGKAPVRVIDFEEYENKLTASAVGEEFYGDSEYNPDELDLEGFDVPDNSAESVFDDERY